MIYLNGSMGDTQWWVPQTMSDNQHKKKNGDPQSWLLIVAI